MVLKILMRVINFKLWDGGWNHLYWPENIYIVYFNSSNHVVGMILRDMEMMLGPPLTCKGGHT